MNRRGYLATLAATSVTLPTALSGCIELANMTSDEDSEGNHCFDWCQSRIDAANTGHLPDYSRSDVTVSEEWTYSTGSKPTGGPLVHDGRVYGSTVEGEIYAVDAESGQELWTESLNAKIFQTPALSDDNLYAVSQAGKLYAIDTEQGDKTEEFDVGSNQFEERYIRSSTAPGVTVKNEIISLGGGNLHVIDSSNSEILITRDSDDVVYSKPAITDDLIIVGQSTGMLQAVDQDTSETVWEEQVTDGPLRMPVIQDDQILISDEARASLHCLDLATGMEQWHVSIDTTTISPPAATSDEVVVTLESGGNSGGAGGIRAFEPNTGDELWQNPNRHGHAAPPIITQGRIYTNQGGKVIVYERDGGKEVSTVIPSPPNKDSLALTEMGIYVQTSVSHVLRRYS
jgi:outer membrane protein assembly factor BamB